MEPDKGRIGKYTLIRLLGKGGTSKVFLARDCETSFLVALKVMDPKRLTSAEVEIEAFRYVPNHPNVIKLYDYCFNAVKVKDNKTKEVAYMALEHANRGEIFDWVFSRGAFPQGIARRYFKELLEGVNALHKAGIVHRDLKPENIFFSENFTLKLADLGFAGPAAGRDWSGTLETYKGTRPYMAPEILERLPYRGVQTDIFSCGIIMFILVTGRPPFRTALKNDPHYRLIVDKNLEKFWSIHLGYKNTPEIPESLRDLLSKMLSYCPSERPGIENILNHNWMLEEIASLEEAVQFLSPGTNIEELIHDEPSPDLDGYRCFSPEEVGLSRYSSRLLVPEETLPFASTRFLSNLSPEFLVGSVKSIVRQKGGVAKEEDEVYSLKASLVVNHEMIEFSLLISELNSKYLAEFKRLSGYHWDFYNTYQEIYQELKHI